MSTKTPSLSSSAEAWFLHMQRPSVSEHEQAIFEQWYLEPKNAKAFHDYEKLWVLSSEIEHSSEVQQWIRDIHQAPDKKETGWRHWWMLAPASICLFICGVLIWSGLQHQEIEYVTAPGQQLSIKLPDGSTATLNTNSKIVVNYNATQRRVALAYGDVAFDVVRNVDKPFRVLVGEQSIHVLGTYFSVQRRNSEIKIAVLHGRVGFFNSAEAGDTRASRAELSQGEGLSIDKQGQLHAMTAADIRYVKGWIKGKLDFSEWTLAQAVEEHNRYTKRDIILVGNELKSATISGIFTIGDTDSFVSAVENLLDVKARQASGHIVITAKHTNP